MSQHAGGLDTDGYGDDPLLAQLGDVAGAHAVVIGVGAIDTMCALLRAGCAAVTEMTVSDRAQADPAEIAVVPNPGSLAMAVQSIGLAFRVLLPGGRLVMRDPTGAMSTAIAAALRLKGFSAVRVRVTEHGSCIVAERPIFGRIVTGARA